MTDLTILCVSASEEYSVPFVDEIAELADDLKARLVVYDGTCAGCIEHVLDDALAECPDGYILRLDDDERCSVEMHDWLYYREYREHDHWAFPRAHLYGDADHYITTAPLWPDLQTRLSVKAKSGGRTTIHQGSPFGTGQIAPVVLEHHKFLIRSEVDRSALIDHYERIRFGAGLRFGIFSLPEHYSVNVEEYPALVMA